MLPKYIVGITHRGGRRGGDVRVERQGTRVQEAAAPARAVYCLPTLVPLVYTATARARETRRASERAGGKCRDGRERDERSVHDVGV